MFKIENLKFHCYNNGATEFYSATLRDNDISKDVRLLQNGNVYSAYEPSTDIIYHITLNNPNVHSLEELRDGDEVEILTAIKKS